MTVDKVWNVTNEVHLTLTEWKPIPLIETHNRRSAELGSSRTRKLGAKSLKKKENRENSVFFNTRESKSEECVLVPTKFGKGSVGGGETDKKTKTTQYVGEKSVDSVETDLNTYTTV